MAVKVGIPVNGSNISGPGEGAEVHIFEIENTKYKLIDRYENPALKATSARGIHMLKSVLGKNVDAIIVAEIGEPGVRFLKNKIKIYYNNNLNEDEAMNWDQWWKYIADKGVFSEELMERSRRYTSGSHDQNITLEEHIDILNRCGFDSVGILKSTGS